jgi:septum formation protein
MVERGELDPAPGPGVDVILASASPRRRELLERVGLRLRVEVADIDESPRPGEGAPDYVRRMAASKAEAALGRAGTREAALGVPLLAADTTVIVSGQILGKPADASEARAMLTRLAGRRHEVTTAYRIHLAGRQIDRAVTTAVAIRLLQPREIDAYVACGEWRGKAGGYAVQGVAAAFVTELRGSLTNVVGLPLAEVLADLRAIGGLGAYPPVAFPEVA